MVKTKSKLQSPRPPALADATVDAGLDLGEFTQQVETPLALEAATEDEPTLVGIDFDEALTHFK